MKIIHTFFPVIYNIDKITIFSMTVSMLLAKRYYNNVVLYTDKKTAEIVRKIGLPYTEINDTLLEGIDVDTFSIPKLLVYKEQKEPFLHIDLDSFIFKKFNLDDFKGIYGSYNESAIDFEYLDDSILGFYQIYLINTLRIVDKLPKDFVKNITFNDVPNMSIFGGYNYDVIAKASDYCLNIYNNNKDFFDTKYLNTCNACIIEQLFITIAIKYLNDKTKYKIKYLYNDIPTKFEFLENNIREFPFIVKSVDKSIVFDDDSDLYNNYNYDFNGFLHLGGEKDFDKILYLLRTLIIKEFDGEKYLNIINQLFPEKMSFEK